MWTASTTYVKGKVIHDGARVFQVDTAGMSGTVALSSLPVISGKVTDGGVTWTLIGTKAVFKKISWHQEEGEFTPVLMAGGNELSNTYAIQKGSYTKQGRLVYINACIRLTALGAGSGAIQIAGLPYISDNSANYQASGTVSAVSGVSLSKGIVSVNINAQADRLTLVNAYETGIVNLDYTKLSNSTTIALNIMYRSLN